MPSETSLADHVGARAYQGGSAATIQIRSPRKAKVAESSRNDTVQTKLQASSYKQVDDILRYNNRWSVRDRKKSMLHAFVAVSTSLLFRNSQDKRTVKTPHKIDISPLALLLLATIAPLRFRAVDTRLRNDDPGKGPPKSLLCHVSPLVSSKFRNPAGSTKPC